MFRDETFTHVSRAGAADDVCADFVMDEDAFRAFYERTARGLWAYLARVTGDRQLADDLLQETFYRFLRANARHESEMHRRNSLYRIATNLARDAARRKVVHAPPSIAGDDIERIPARADGTMAGNTADVTRAMSNLKPRERAILWLAYAEGASHQEIADVVGVRAGSLKPMLFRARRKLAALLGRGPQKDETMKPMECEFESEALAAALQSRWPDRVDAGLREHVATCAICSDVIAIAGAIDDARMETRALAAIPDSGQVWWRAQLRARREAAAMAGRPITAVQVITLACAMGLLGACFGAMSAWFQSALGSITSSIAGFRLQAALLSAAALVSGHGLFVIALVAMLLLAPVAVCFAVLRD